MAKMPIFMLAVAALLALGRPAETQQRSWPVRPVKLVVSTPPGSGQDLIARNLTEPLQKRLGQPFIVENIPGAGSVRSADVVVKAPADGYTVLVANIAPIGIVPNLRANMPYNAAKDLLPVGQINTSYFMVMVNPKRVPVSSFPELIRAAQGQSRQVPLRVVRIGWHRAHADGTVHAAHRYADGPHTV